jgi:hypothetical protein
MALVRSRSGETGVKQKAMRSPVCPVKKCLVSDGHQWLTLVILAIQKAGRQRSGRLWFEANPGK